MMVSGQGGAVDGMWWWTQIVYRHVILQTINDFLTFVRDWALCVIWALSPKTSHQSIFYPHHCICKTTINYKASQKSSENPSTFWHLQCAPSLERTGQHDVCHSLYLYPAVYLKRCGQTVENHSWANDTDRSHFFI